MNRFDNAVPAPDDRAESAEHAFEQPAVAGLIEQIIEAAADKERSAGWLHQFLSAPSDGEALGCLLRESGSSPGLATKREITSLVIPMIAALDAILTRQVNAILHHPRFQALEASWRGLEYLVEQSDPEALVKIRALNVSRAELQRDFDGAIEFDQSQLFRKVYSQEFGMPGGEPFGLLLGDFEFTNHPNDVDFLEKVSGVAASAFAPFVAAAAPRLLDLDDFGILERSPDLSGVFQQHEYLLWRSFRESEDARFVGLTLPRVLIRTPYSDGDGRVDGFRFREDTTGPDARNYLWTNAAYAFGAVVVRAFAQSGWLADVRGVQRGAEAGGLVTGLAVDSFATDKHGVVPKCTTEVMISGSQEKELGELGFMPLCDCKDTPYSAFYSVQSVQKPKKYDDYGATLNSRISAMLQYVLCVSRFAHYVKVLGRERVGSFAEATEIQRELQNWVRQYVTADESAGPAAKAKRPLRKAEILVRDVPGKPGRYSCEMRLWPHFQLDELTATVKLVTELAPEHGH